MLAEAEILIDLNTQLHFETVVSVQNGVPGVLTSLANSLIMPHLLGPKKPTRQWAAWTRQEKESFFTALRQVERNCHSFRL